MNKRVRDLINESGAGLWGTDKARERLQKDTPGQEIKSLVKKSQKVSERVSDIDVQQAKRDLEHAKLKKAKEKVQKEAADPKGTIKVVKQDKVRYITKDELNTYRQMGWKQAEKRPQGDDKIRAAKKAHAAGTWDGNVNKDGKPIVHIDGKPVVVEDVKNPYKAYDSQKLQQLKKNMRDNVANLTQRIRKRAGNASQSLKDELKDLERKSKLIDLALKDVNQRKQDQKDKIQLARSYAKPGSSFHSKYRGAGMSEDSDDADRRDKLKMVNKNGNVVYATRDKVKHYMDLGYKSAAYMDARKKTLSRSNQNPEKSFADVRRIAKDIQNKKAGDTPPRYRESVKEEVVQLDELKISFKFDKLADAAKAERKAMQMKKLDVDSEKVQGKNMWLLHVSGNYTDIMKYIKRVDLEDKVHESKEMSLDDIKKRYAKEIIAFQDNGKDLSSGAKMALYGYVGSDGLKTDDADEFDDFVMGLQMGKYKTEAKAGDNCSCCGNKIDEHGKCGCDESCKHCGGHHNISEGSESWEAGYKRRVVKTTKPEHKEKGYNWRIKGKDKAHLTIKLYKEKPSQAEFNKQMKRVAGHEFGG